MVHWLSVEEELPEIPQDRWFSPIVIGYTKDGEICLVRREFSMEDEGLVEHWRYCWDRVADVQVIYWMPLPLPPQDRDSL